MTPSTPLKRPSLTNKSVHERLRSSSRSNRFRKQGILPSCKPSQVNKIKHKKYEKEIRELNPNTGGGEGGGGGGNFTTQLVFP